MTKIKKISAMEILDSRGNPTIEVIVETGKVLAKAMVPSGASTGSYEAYELRDRDVKRYLGKGVLGACRNVETKIDKLLKGKDVGDQEMIDQLMIDADGTENKKKLGANAILAVSMACARAYAMEQKIGLYRSFEKDACVLPVPLMNIINGGAHADSGLSVQEFMIVPAGAENFSEALRMGAEIFHNLGKLLKDGGQKTTVGDEGGYAPSLNDNEEAIKLIEKAVEKSGYKLGTDILLALDTAASEFYDKKSNSYKMMVKGKKESFSNKEMAEYWYKLSKKYPIISIEDGLSEDDFEGWEMLMKKMNGKVQVVGDDLFVTNKKRLEQGIEKGLANSILVKLNQIGTVTETLEAIEMAQENDFTAVISHRSGETEDSFIADLAVGVSAGQIKTGSLSRSERLAKYNQLLRIEKELGKKAIYAGFGAFHQLKNYA